MLLAVVCTYSYIAALTGLLIVVGQTSELSSLAVDRMVFSYNV